MIKVDVYTRDGCRFCDAAKLILSMKQIEYTEYIIDKDITLSETKQTFPTAQLLPIVRINDDYIGSYNELIDYLMNEERKI